MANAVAEGARQAGAHVDIKRVPELVPEEIACKSHYKLDQLRRSRRSRTSLPTMRSSSVPAPGLAGCHRNWPISSIRQIGSGCVEHCTAKSAARSRRPPHNTATQHGVQEMTLFSIITNLLYFGIVVVGLDYGYAGQMTFDEITGASTYGATTIPGGDGSRLPTANELQGARYQGRKIAETAIKLHR
jgi:NAD(P)H dehydrogenase (quinone)